jgi:PAS domain S-box-containing protein
MQAARPFAAAPRPAAGVLSPQCADPAMSGRSRRTGGLAAWCRHWLSLATIPAIVVLALLVLLIGGMTAATHALIQRNEAHAAEEAFARAREHARLLQAEWTDTLARIDGLQRLARLVTLARLAHDSATQAKLTDELRSAVSVTMPTITQVSAVDPKGAVMWSTLRVPDQPIDLANREHVKAIISQDKDHFIGRPVIGLLSQRLSIHFSVALRGPDGALLGLTVVSLDTSQINTMVHGLDPRGQNFVSILRRDGVVLAHSDGRGVGLDLAARSPKIPQLLMQEDTQWRGPSMIDGVRRFIVGRTLPGMDTAVVVALDEARELAPARAAAAQMWRWSVLLDVCLAALAALLLALLAQNRRVRLERLRHAEYRAQETFLRQIADEAIDLIALLDADHRFLYVNPACRRLMGMEQAALLGQVASNCIAPNYRAELQAVLDSLTLGGGPHRLLVPLLRPDSGTPRWIEIEASHIDWPPQDTSHQRGCFFIARDVTERKQADDALQRAREDLETVSRAGPGALYRLALASDGTRRLLFLADIGRAYLGFTYEEARAPGFFQAVLHPADLAAYEAGIAALRRDGEATMEYRLQDRDGTFRWIRDTCVVTEARKGKLLISGYCSEITREKEQAEQLEQAQRLLSLGEMASGLAHELNQPLAAISLAAENGKILLTRGAAALPAASEKFGRIASLAERAAAIIESMRVFGRADAPPPVLLNLADTVRDALGVMRARLERERIAVVFNVPDLLPQVTAVPVLLQQVVINLIVNACDAYRTSETIEPRRQIDIALWADPATVWLEVADRAGGIPPETLARVFEPFFTTKSHGGTGMGLAVSYGIVRQLGGSITAHNRLGGAVFQIGLPAHHPYRSVDDEPALEPIREPVSIAEPLR